MENRTIKDDQEMNNKEIFRDFNAEFYRRATNDVYFTCSQGHEIAAGVIRAAAHDDRVDLPLHAIATVPSENDEPVARFRLTLSLKRSAC